MPRIIDIYRGRGGVDATDAVAIISYALSLRKEDVYARFDSEISEEEATRIGGLLEERRCGKPLAYITKRKEFFSEDFFVDQRVLIPRPETELVVEEVVNILKKKGRSSYIMDMGTGSGTIGLVLGRAGYRVVCVDVSFDALRVARVNAGRLNVSDRVVLVCSDLWGGIRETRVFDVVVANLPYVSDKQWDELDVGVRGFEPAVALKGGEKGDEVYERLIRAIRLHLKGGGHLVVEIDGRPQARRVRQMFLDAGFRVTIKKDLSGRERVLIGLWKGS